MSSQSTTHPHASSQVQDPETKGDHCRGVIKKLFPTKRYGFVVLECSSHVGEAHFNYSDLLIEDRDRNCLCIGWRLEFQIFKQEQPTNHCLYRATQVRPIPVMVVQCELVDGHTDSTLTFNSRELGGKFIHCRRNAFNGKSEGPNSKESCRAAITWEQLKSHNPFASHCSQNTPNSRDGRDTQVQTRSVYKTPERRVSRKESSSVQGVLQVNTNVNPGNTPTGITPTANNDHSSANGNHIIKLADLSRVGSNHLHSIRRPLDRVLEDSGLSASPDTMNLSTGSLSGVATSTPKSERQTRIPPWTTSSPYSVDEIKSRVLSQDPTMRETYWSPTERDLLARIWEDNTSPRSPRNLIDEFSTADHHQHPNHRTALDNNNLAHRTGFSSSLNDASARFATQFGPMAKSPLGLTLPDNLRQNLEGLLSSDADPSPPIRSSIGNYATNSESPTSDSLLGGRQFSQASSDALRQLGFHSGPPQDKGTHASVYAGFRDFSAKTALSGYSAAVGEQTPYAPRTRPQLGSMLMNFNRVPGASGTREPVDHKRAMM